MFMVRIQYYSQIITGLLNLNMEKLSLDAKPKKEKLCLPCRSL